jgi:hypothetical protein
LLIELHGDFLSMIAHVVSATESIGAGRRGRKYDAMFRPMLFGFEIVFPAKGRQRREQG